jgi:hypothetical protein
VTDGQVGAPHDRAEVRKEGAEVVAVRAVAVGELEDGRVNEEVACRKDS